MRVNINVQIRFPIIRMGNLKLFIHFNGMRVYNVYLYIKYLIRFECVLDQTYMLKNKCRTIKILNLTNYYIAEKTSN